MKRMEVIGNVYKKCCVVVLQLLEHLKGGRPTVFHGTSTLHKPVPVEVEAEAEAEARGPEEDEEAPVPVPAASE